MKSLIIIALFAVALASANQNQTVSVSDAPDFFVGVNSGLGINVTSDAISNCVGAYYGVVFMTGEFLEHLFSNWEFDFILLQGLFGEDTYGEFLNDWKDSCLPVANEYGNYFGNAVYAYEENRETFLSTVESNFDSNEIEVIELAIAVSRQIESAEYFNAGEDFASILKIVLSTWL